MLYDIIVIGAGPAGINAGIYASRKGLKTLVISKDVGGQAAITGDIENYLGYSLITGPELTQKFRKHLTSFKEIEFKEGVEVVDLKRSAKGFQVVDNSGAAYQSRIVIIASGRVPRWLNIPGEAQFKGRGVSSCATCDGPLFRGKDVAVVGGGNAGLAAVELLIKFSPKIYLINLTAQLTGDEVLQKKVRASEAVQIMNDTTAVEIKGGKTVESLLVENVRTKEKRELNVQGVFVEIGWQPSLTFDKLTEKDEHGAIKVNADLETSVPGIYAAGDVNNLWGEQIIIAAGEGAKAAMKAAEYLSRK